VEAKVTGSIPDYAAGTLYRTGPGGYTVKANNGSTISMSHWFDGFSQVHRFQIIPPSPSQPSTKVLYNSRHTCDDVLESMRTRGSCKDFTFGQKRDPCQSFFKKVMSVFTALSQEETKSGQNIGVTLTVNSPGMNGAIKGGKEEGTGHASGINTLFTKTDAAMFQQLDPETLEPVGIADQTKLHPDLKGPLSGAHAKSDPVTGDVFNYNLAFGRKPIYRIFRTSASTGETEIIAKINDAPGAYLHSFTLTENYVVLAVWSSYYAMGGVKMLLEKNILDTISDFDPNRKVAWYVIDRRQGKGVVSTFKSDPFFCFHTVNGWEEPSKTVEGETDIVTDLLAYDNLDVLKRLYYDHIMSSSDLTKKYLPGTAVREGSRWYLKRFRLPAVTQKTQQKEVLVDWTASKDNSGELPTLNPKYITKKHRHSYGVSDHGKSALWDTLVKYDTETHQSIFWSVDGQTPGEAIFIPDPERTEEDDGVLLSVVLDGFAGKSYLLCLDAKTMKERGRASLENAVGFGFHGTHVPKRKETDTTALDF
jgi:torulene dioxygenase